MNERKFCITYFVIAAIISLGITAALAIYLNQLFNMMIGAVIGIPIMYVLIKWRYRDDLKNPTKVEGEKE